MGSNSNNNAQNDIHDNIGNSNASHRTSPLDDPPQASDSDNEELEGYQDLLDVEGWNLRHSPPSTPTMHRGGLSGTAGMQGFPLYCPKVPVEEMNPYRDEPKQVENRRASLLRWRNVDKKRQNEASASTKSVTNILSHRDANHIPKEMYSRLPSEAIEDPDDSGEDDLVELEAEEEEEHDRDNFLRPGDHIYVWQTYGINPRAYQRHAVVLTIAVELPSDSRDRSEPLSYNMDHLYKEKESNDENIQVTVVSFYHFQKHDAHGAAYAAAAATGNRRGKRTGCKCELLHSFIGEDGLKKKKPVHKVRYGRQMKKGILSQKTIVGTALKKDQVGLILARVQYLLDHPGHLPDHNALSSNGECAAMWCVTGRWCTLQGASILQITCVGQAGGTLVAGGILSNLTVLVPMPGLWGLAGWWWYVPATVAYPVLVPMLVALGMASLVPLEILRRNRKKWRGITDGLNHEFWANADEDIKEKYFGVTAMAEKEAEMTNFFGMGKRDANNDDDAKYMPIGSFTSEIDESDGPEETLAMQEVEQSCKKMASDINLDLSGKPDVREWSRSGKWGSFLGKNVRQKDNKGVGELCLRNMCMEDDLNNAMKEKESIIS